MLVKTGAAADPAGEEGLASITAELLRKGTEKRTAQQFAADLDFTGGSFEADAGADYSSVSGEFLNKDIAKGLELYSDALLHPIFPQTEVDKLLAQSLDAVRAAKDDARSVLATYFNGYLFNGAGYGRTSDGDEVSLKRIQREAIVKFYETNYAPGNTILAVAGDFPSAEMKRKLEGTFGSWPAKAVTPAKIAAAPPVRRQTTAARGQAGCHTNIFCDWQCRDGGGRSGSCRDPFGQYSLWRAVHLATERGATGGFGIELRRRIQFR